ncbi:MAG: hypothetical protein Q9P01_12285 [Anaerolineae bacterium]|nr:hypothetical protein [Anaerolineae bacterium]
MTHFGRRTLTVANYVAQAKLPDAWEWANNRWEDGSGTAINHNTPKFDQNIISQTSYNRAGQVLSTRDARGTETTFAYDGSGRRVMVTAAANTGQRARTYTCFDKAGRVLRTLQGYASDGSDPDAWDGSGAWIFAPATNGYYSDDNRSTEHEYDLASRRVKTTNPTGDSVQTAYFIDGQVDSVTDPTNIVTLYRYDQLNRRKLVVQNYVANGEDPTLWVYDSVTDNRYEKSDGTAIVHGTNNDKNIIVQVDYDIAGRMTQMRDPRGNLTSYDYDVLGRRTKLTNPLSKIWQTAYTEVNQAQRTTLTYPGLSTGGTYNVVRDFDRMGRLQQIDYNAATTTPKVNFTYDILGQRESMTENDGTSDIRKTGYFYDNANRLNKVEFDNDGGGTVDDSVDYEYDLGGRRTKLTMPGNKSISYTYDQKGRLIRLTDWDNQTTSFTYDKADRHVRTRRSNGLDSLYKHDAAGRLRTLHHLQGKASLRQTFNYTVNALGNRTQAQEVTPRTSGATATDMTHTYPAIVYRGDWNSAGLYHEATVHDASVSLLFYGETATLTMGKNDDCSLFDVYIDGTLWLSFDAYAATASDLTISIDVEGTGLHLLEVKNRLEHNVKSTGYKIRFKLLNAQPAFDVSTIDYTYDEIARLSDAVYADGSRSYGYEYDVAGNRTQEQVTIGITTTTTNWTYNAANQIATMQIGANPASNFTHDSNGNLTSDGQFTYTWDRGNRLTALNTGSVNHNYAYNGDNNRVQQTIGGVATNYLLDIQPELALVLAESTPTETLRYVHSPRGVHSVEDNAGDWHWMMTDGLSSVRSQVDDLAQIEASQQHSPYGQPFNQTGSLVGTFGYANEQIDSHGLSYNRARYYAPDFGTFAHSIHLKN